jgi:hypothetical protein
MFRDDEGGAHVREVPIAVVEQRVSNLAQGSLCLVLLTKPFLHVLNLVPQGARSDSSCACSSLTPSHRITGVLAGLLYVALPLAFRV